MGLSGWRIGLLPGDPFIGEAEEDLWSGCNGLGMTMTGMMEGGTGFTMATNQTENNKIGQVVIYHKDNRMLSTEAGRAPRDGQ